MELSRLSPGTAITPGQHRMLLTQPNQRAPNSGQFIKEQYFQEKNYHSFHAFNVEPFTSKDVILMSEYTGLGIKEY